MTRSILAYFKSENDAESAKANLQRLRVSDVYIDTLPEGEDKMFVPLFTMGITSTSNGVMGTFNYLENAADEDSLVTHLLEGKVEEEDFDDARRILSESKGYRRND